MNLSAIILSVGARAVSKIDMKSGSLAFFNLPNICFTSLSSNIRHNSSLVGVTILPPDPAAEAEEWSFGDGVAGWEEGRGEGVDEEGEFEEAAGEVG